MDDDEEIVRRRLRTHQEKCQPAVDYYRRFGKVRSVNADRPIDEVYQDFKAILLDVLVPANSSSSSSSSSTSSSS
jgi:adenylate kinase family enzyme